MLARRPRSRHSPSSKPRSPAASPYSRLCCGSTCSPTRTASLSRSLPSQHSTRSAGLGSSAPNEPQRAPNEPEWAPMNSGSYDGPPDCNHCMDRHSPLRSRASSTPLAPPSPMPTSRGSQRRRESSRRRRRAGPDWHGAPTSPQPAPNEPRRASPPWRLSGWLRSLVWAGADPARDRPPEYRGPPPRRGLGAPRLLMDGLCRLRRR